MIKFLSFLGTNKYEVCNYFYQDQKVENCCYIQEALLKILVNKNITPDMIVFFTTRKSHDNNWIKNANEECGKPGLKDTLENLKSNMNRVIIKNVMIPDGNNYKELWEIFDIIFNEIEKGDELIFDITHSFRFLPMMAFLVLNYARIVKNCTIYAVFYGGFEVLGTVSQVKQMPLEKRNAPVFELTPFIDVFDWTVGIDRYLNTGDVSLINNLTVSGVKAINKEILKSGENMKDLKTAGLLKDLAAKLQTYSDAVFTCRGRQLSKAARELKKIVEEVVEKSAHDYLKPLAPVMEKLYDRFKVFGKNEYEDLLEIVKWCRDNKLYQQGLTILEEGLIGYICDVSMMNKIDLNDRKLASQCVAIKNRNIPREKWESPARENPEIVRSILNSNRLCSELWNLIYCIQNARNDINHAGWQKNPRHESTFKNELEKFIKTAENIISTAPAASPKSQGQPRKMLLIFSHDMTDEQKREARKNLGVEEFISLPPDLQEKWSNIPAGIESLEDYIRDILHWTSEYAAAGDYALVEGDFGATYILVGYCKKKGIIPVYSTTERKVVEEHVDGEVRTCRSFRHVRFRVYGH
ncbi:CRISPR-associated protein Csx20 [Thermoanaerobacterium sp. DL9XJH110]|uniref:CRISPR-associated protein Csx20 n=1 Tax=Thermoanaerobacterium sp. DL9XJH110 TaxID=3386643 RepID=UPI003BB6750C